MSFFPKCSMINPSCLCSMCFASHAVKCWSSTHAHPTKVFLHIFLHVQKWKLSCRETFLLQVIWWIFCTFFFFCIEQLDRKNKSVRHSVFKCAKCVAWPSFFLFPAMTKVVSGSEACSWKHYAAFLICARLWKLDDVFKELHGSHYIFILLRKENTRLH